MGLLRALAEGQTQQVFGDKNALYAWLAELGMEEVYLRFEAAGYEHLGYFKLMARDAERVRTVMIEDIRLSESQADRVLRKLREESVVKREATCRNECEVCALL